MPTFIKKFKENHVESTSMVTTQWCWEGECVAYGILLDNGDPISQGRFKCSDIDALPSRFSLQETTPEELGLARESEDCSALNDWLFPPEFLPPIPPRLILDVKNNITFDAVAPVNVRFEIIANPEIDRVSIVRTIWDFGDGTPPIVTEGLFGQNPGFIQNHTFQDAINFNGTVTLQILDANRNILDQETVNFDGMVLGSIEETFVPLAIILDVFPRSNEAPTIVDVAIIGNQAIEDIVIDWGDGSAPEAIGFTASHQFNNGGQFLIEVFGTSRISGERTSQTDLLILEAPLLPEVPIEEPPEEEPIPEEPPIEEVPEVPIVVSNRTRNLILLGVAVLIGAGVVIAATRK